MKNFFLIFMVGVIIGCNAPNKRLQYPVTKKGDIVEVYFGDTVDDPYRWLENDRADDVGKWVTAQNKVTNNYLGKIPFRKAIEDRLTKLLDYPRISAPFKKGGNYFFFKNDGLQNQSVAYIKKTLDSKETVVLDPNQLSEDGTVALANFSPSENGKYIAYGVSRSGSDWREFFVKDLATGKDLEDHIQWVKFSSISWFQDGFFYSRYPKPNAADKLKGENKNNKVYYHKIGTPQTADELVYEDTENPKWGFHPNVTEDERYLVVEVNESTSGNALYAKNLEEDGSFVKLIKPFDNDYIIVGNIGEKLLVLTNADAPNYKVITIDMRETLRGTVANFIEEKETVLENIQLVGNKIIAEYLKDAKSHIEIYDRTGTYEYDVALPFLGSVSGFSGNTKDTETFYTITSFTTPAEVYRYTVADNKSILYQTTDIDFDAEQYTTEQVFYQSSDGTKIPMFIVHKKGIKRDGQNPVLLYGYGGFNISLTPSFRTTRLAWLEQGGIFAMANLRGGGEYGKEWHKAGTKMRKKNVFNDCIAAAEYLIAQKYTSKGKIALQGGSNGGLLVGAVINQRPDLFGVGLPAVGVMDMLRYHKFTIGRYWATDYGTSEESPEMFRYLLSYSPVHTVKNDAKYPSILVTTGDHDDRVVPAHSFKYIATLQENYQGENPVLIRIETDAGHGAGKPMSKIIEEQADIYTFLFNELDITPKY